MSSPSSTLPHKNPGDRTLTLIFVYGSLKRGYALHHLLASQQFHGSALTQPLYRLFVLGAYPGLIDSPDGIGIHGEVYQVTCDCLTKLDEAEGVEVGCYARRIIQLQPPFDQCAVYAWFWLHAVRGLKDCGHSWPVA